jgi:hypothetical protein
MSALALSPWVSWDAKCAARAFGLATVAFAIAWLVTAVTDEGGVSWAARAGRALPAMPLCAAFGTWSTLASRRGRGERLALETLGRSPQFNALGAVLGGVVLSALAGIALLASPRIDAGGFFPAMPQADELIFDAGTFIDVERGLRIEGDGSYTRIDKEQFSPKARADRTAPPGGRTAAATVIVVAAAALSLLAVCGRERKTLIAMALGLLPTMVFFHAAAAARAAPERALAGALIFPAALLVYALVRYRRWHGEAERPT